MTDKNTVFKWFAEVSRANTAGKPVIIVGTKQDLRDDPDALQRLEARHLAPTSFDQGMKLARELGAASYVECSCTSPNGLTGLSELLEDLVAGPSKSKRKRAKSSKTQSSSSDSSGPGAHCSLL